MFVVPVWVFGGVVVQPYDWRWVDGLSVCFSPRSVYCLQGGVDDRSAQVRGRKYRPFSLLEDAALACLGCCAMESFQSELLNVLSDFCSVVLASDSAAVRPATT